MDIRKPRKGSPADGNTRSDTQLSKIKASSPENTTQKPRDAAERILRRLRIGVLRFNMVKILAFGHYSDIPERNIVWGYLVYMLLGWGLLLLPWSHVGDAMWLDDLFTAASAVSTTGLSTVVVGERYTLFGMIMILLLVQVGGIGYMTISSYLIYRLTHHSLRSNAGMVMRTMSIPVEMDLRTLVYSVAHFTLAFELAGFLILWWSLWYSGIEHAAWYAVFLSVSSFCTAGFSPFPDSLCSFSGNMGVTLTVAFLSYAGALGFIVMTDISRKLHTRSYRITFTTKVILFITMLMTVVGTIFLTFGQAMAQEPSWPRRVAGAFFQTMSAMTTVGFNNVNLGMLSAGGAVVLSLVMFVGASPSGTGGGVKSTAVSATWAFVISRLGLRKDVTLRGNRLPSYRVDSALTNILTYGGILFLGVLALVCVEPIRMEALIFEAASALGTVGLSMNVTPSLTAAGKIIVIVLMYIGRIGVITFGSALVIKARDNARTPAPRTDLAV